MTTNGDYVMVNPVNLITELTESMGYCCPYAFFLAHKGVRTQVIADKLGISKSTVRNWRINMENGEVVCKGIKRCLRDKIRLVRR